MAADDVDWSDHSPFLYHVTWARNLPSIAEYGLAPRFSGGAGLGSGGYAGHSSRGIFVSEWPGVRFWFDRAEERVALESDDPAGEGVVPLVLRVLDLDEDALEDDTAGTSDAREDAYIYPNAIPVEHLEVWDGEGWVAVDEADIDPEDAFDEDGELLEEYFLPEES